MVSNEIRDYVLRQIKEVKDRMNRDEKILSDFSEVLKRQSDIQQTDLEIQQIESEQAITDLEIEIAELYS